MANPVIKEEEALDIEEKEYVILLEDAQIEEIKTKIEELN